MTVPLWRPHTHEHKPLTFELVLPGKVPSKKNRQRASIRFAGALRRAAEFVRDNPSPAEGEVYSFIKGLLRSLRPYIYKPPEIEEWEEGAKAELVRQMDSWRERCAAYKITLPITRCSVSIKYHWADQHRRDNINRDQTIHDVLVEARIIDDDTYTCLFKTTSEAGNYAGLITDHVTVIHITAYDWVGRE